MILSGRTILVSFCLLLVAAIIGCTRETRHRTLTFFFDGVPALDGREETATTGPIHQLAAFNQTFRNPASLPSPILSSHKPFTERKCGECHLPDSPTQLVMPLEDLCIECHGETVKEKGWNHGPVEAGACIFCHDYHQSTEPHLLLRQSDALCYQCHLEEDLEFAEEHNTAEDWECLDCHDAHIMEKTRTPVRADAPTTGSL